MHRHALLAIGLIGLLALLFTGCTDGSDSHTPPANTVSLSFFNLHTRQGMTPLLVAFQDGVGASWTPLSDASMTSSVDSPLPGLHCQLTVTNPAGTYGVLAVLDTGNCIGTYIFQNTLAEGRVLNYAVQDIYYAPSSRDIAGSRATDDYWTLSSDVLYPNFTTFNFSSFAGPKGSQLNSQSGLIQHLYFPPGRLVDYGMVLNKTLAPSGSAYLYLRRNVIHAAGIHLYETIDFTPPYDGSKGTHELAERGTISAPGYDDLYVSLWTANGTLLPLQGPFCREVGYPLLPEDIMEDGDRYVYDACDGDEHTQARLFSHTPVTSVSLPDAFTCGFTRSPLPTFSQLDHPGISLYKFMLKSDDTHSWKVRVTAGWLQAAGVTSYTLPDPNTLEGWQANWGFYPIAQATQAQVDAVEFNTSLSTYLSTDLPTYLQPTPPDGACIKTAYYRAYPR